MNKKIKIFNTFTLLPLIALAYAGCLVVSTPSSSSTVSSSSNNQDPPPPPPPSVKIKPQLLLREAADPKKTGDDLYQTYTRYKQTNLKAQATKAEAKKVFLPLVDPAHGEESFLLKLSENPDDDTNVEIIKDVINTMGADWFGKTKNGPKVIDALTKNNLTEDLLLYCLDKGCAISSKMPQEVFASDLTDQIKDDQLALMLNNDKTQSKALKDLTQKTDDADLNQKKDNAVNYYYMFLQYQATLPDPQVQERATKKVTLFPKKIVAAFADHLESGEEINLGDKIITILKDSNASLAPIVKAAARNFTTNTELNLSDELIAHIVKQNTDLTLLLKAVAYNISSNRKLPFPSSLLAQIANQKLDLTVLLNDKRLKEDDFDDHVKDVQKFLRKLKNNSTISPANWNKMVEGMRTKLKAYYNDEKIEEILGLENKFFAQLEEDFSNVSDTDFKTNASNYLSSSKDMTDYSNRANKLADLLLTNPDLRESRLLNAKHEIKNIITYSNPEKADAIKQKIRDTAFTAGNAQIFIDFELDVATTFTFLEDGLTFNFLQILMDNNIVDSKKLHANAVLIKKQLGNDEAAYRDYLSKDNDSESILKSYSGKEGYFIDENAAFEFFNQPNGDMNAFDSLKKIPYFSEAFVFNNPDFLVKFDLMKTYLQGEAKQGFKDRLIRLIPLWLTRPEFNHNKAVALSAVFEEVKDEQQFLDLKCPSDLSNSCLEVFVKNFDYATQTHKNEYNNDQNPLNLKKLNETINPLFYLQKNNDNFDFKNKRLLVPLLENYYYYLINNEDEAVSNSIKTLVSSIFSLPENKDNNEIKSSAIKFILQEEKNPDRIAYFNNLPAFNNALALTIGKDLSTFTTIITRGYQKDILYNRFVKNSLDKVSLDKTSKSHFYVDLFSNDYAGSKDTLLIYLLKKLKENNIDLTTRFAYDQRESTQSSLTLIAKKLKELLPNEMSWSDYKQMPSKNGLTLDQYIKQNFAGLYIHNSFE